LGGRDQEDCVLRPAGAKCLQDPHLTNGMMRWHARVIPAVQGSTNRRTVVQASPCINKTLS
jgi:hypothetical protein